MSWNALMEVINPITIICYLDLEGMFARTTFREFLIEDVHEMKSLTNTLCQSNQIFYCFFQLMSLMLNLCLCIDLILTIYNPFQPAAKRLKWYLASSFLATFFIIALIFILENTDDTEM